MASIAAIEVRNYDEMETSRGVAYKAEIWIDGEQAGYLENRGDGGETSIKIDREKQPEFERRVEAYYDLNPATLNGEEYFFHELIDLYEAELIYHSKAKPVRGLLVLMYGYERHQPMDDIELDDLEVKHFLAASDEAVQKLLALEKPPRHYVFRNDKDFALHPELTTLN